MIINENNKNSILKGMVKRGFNQDPNELREKLQSTKKINFNSNENKTIQPGKVSIQNGQLKETFTQFRRFKWK